MHRQAFVVLCERDFESLDAEAAKVNARARCADGLDGGPRDLEHRGVAFRLDDFRAARVDFSIRRQRDFDFEREGAREIEAAGERLTRGLSGEVPKKPPVEALRRARVPMAVASDLNPGSSPVHSLLTTMNMACVLFGLHPEESLAGVTRVAASALGFSDRGRIAAGLRGDLAVWNAARPGDLAYPLGLNLLKATIRGGDCVRGVLR